VLLLALFSLLSERKKLRAVMAGLLVAGIVLALGRFNPAYGWLYQHFALVRIGRYPAKFFLLATLALAILTSLGLEAIVREPAGYGRRRRILAYAGLALGATFLVWTVYWQAHPVDLATWIRSQLDPPSAASKNLVAISAHVRASLLSTAIFLLLASVLVLVAPFRRRPVVTGCFLIALLAAELLPANLGMSPLISDADMDYVPEVNKYIREHGPAEPYRIVSPRLLQPDFDLPVRIPNRSFAWLTLMFRVSGMPFHGVLSGLQYALDASIDALNTRESAELEKACTLMPGVLRLNLLQKLNAPMVLALAELKDPRVRPIATFSSQSQLDVHLYWLENTVSRAYFATGVESASSHADALLRFLRPEFPFGNTVVLENSEREATPAQPGAGRASVVEYRQNRVTCETEARTAGYLVLLDSYYPGWRAFVDGRETPVVRANYAFRAVAVPAGRHRIELRFRPRSFFVGLGLTGLALLVGLGALVRRA
jgi:hypothetical protein